MLDKYDILNLATDKDMKMTVAKIYEVYEKAKFNNIPSSTQFLSPNMVSFVLEHFRDNEISINIFGGYENAERVSLLFAPKKSTFNNSYYNIDILKVSYITKYSRELKHSDYLGSLLGLSIKRELVGDILVEEDCAYIFVLNTMSDYIVQNLKKVGRTNIKIQKTSEDFEFVSKTPEEFSTTVSSLRIDVVICKIFNLSRNDVKELFDSGKVFVNWISVNDISKVVKDDDVITLRGHGRIKFSHTTGTNKKGKVAIVYFKY